MLANDVLTITALLSATSFVSGLLTDYEDLFGAKEADRNQFGREATDEADESFGDLYCDVYGNKTCVSFYLCNEDGFIRTDGSLLIDEQRDQPSENLEQCPKLEVCCNKENYIPTITKNMCSGGIPTPSKCGFRNEEGLGGLSDGKRSHAKYAEFPWMVVVLFLQSFQNKSLPIFLSGGSLIHPKVVLTAAHPVDAKIPTSLTVRAGEWNSQREVEPCSPEERKVQKVITHEMFVRTNLQNDLALLVLDTEFVLTPFVNTVCLPPVNTNFDGQRCFGSGWGKHKFGRRGTYSDIIKKVELPVVPSESCENMLSRTRLGEHFKLHDGFLCAGGEEGISLCTGDGGSPLVCSVPSAPQYFYQAGIMAGGIGCGAENVPSLFVSVSKYRNWIEAKFSELGLQNASHVY